MRAERRRWRVRTLASRFFYVLACLCVPAVWAAALAAPVASPDDVSSPTNRAFGSEAATAGQDLRSSGHVAGPVDASTYLIGPGDVLQLNYSGRVSRTVVLPVGPEGTVFIPGWGVFKPGGLTLAEARRDVDQRVTTQLVGIQLDLTLIRVRMLRVYLTGEVRFPGALELVATSRVSDALPDTSVAPDASRRNIDVRHADNSINVADPGRFEGTGEPMDDPYLRDGDVLYVPKATRFVEVSGAVAHPGRFELGPRDSLHTLLELAGWALPNARPDHVLYVRWLSATQAESLFCDLSDIAARVINPAVGDGARLYVYFVPRFHALEQVSILGEVRAQGTYPLETGKTRLSDMLRFAGGFTDRADQSTIHVYRSNAEAMEDDPEVDRLARLSRAEMTGAEYEILRTRLAARRTEYRVDWTRLQGHRELDIVLVEGDVIYVDPVRATVRVDGEVRSPGLVQYEPRLSALEYVHLAGGFSQRAAESKVLVTRRVTGQTLRARDVDQVSPGDMIWVPERPEITVWQGLQTLITVAAQLAAVIIAVRR